MTSEIIQDIKDVLVFGLVLGVVYGLVSGLVFGLVTQIIAFLTNNVEFSLFDFWSMLILLIVVQVVGWIVYYKLKEKGE